MTAAIGVLCARARVEEKQLLAALAEVGVPAKPLAPAACPYPISPVPTPPGPVEPSRSTGPTTGANAERTVGCEVILDRLADRALAAALLPLWQAQGRVVLGAGLAATGNRAVVAAALTAAGLPRPATFLVPSEEAAVAALDRIGFPATLLPVPGGATIALWDRDAAEAVLEHRAVLGGAAEAVVLVQAGAPEATERALVHVVGGEAVAAEDPGNLIPAGPAVVELAEAAANALGATVAGVEIALTPAGFVVWDVRPVADFRHAVPLHGRTAAAAIADLAAAHLAARPAFKRAVRVQVHAGAGESSEAEAEDGPGAAGAAPAIGPSRAVGETKRRRAAAEVARDAVLTA